MKRLILLALALLACSSREPASIQPLALADCGAFGGQGGASGGMGGASGSTTVPPPVAPGQITGFGVNGQPRNWGTNGAAVKPALSLLVNDLGANFFRVEAFRGQSTWESTNDNADPASFNWTAYDAIFGAKDFTDLFDYVRHLNTLGVTEIALSLHGPLPSWMGGTSLNTSAEDEFVETVVALLVYARTRAPDPKPVFTMVSPWNEPTGWWQGEGFDISASPQGVRVARKLVDRMNALPELDGVGLLASDEAGDNPGAQWRSALLGDSVVTARLRGTAFHRYSWTQQTGGWVNADPPHWLTEFNSTWQAACYSTTWAMGLDAATNLRDALNGGVTAGIFWSDYDAPHSHQGDEWQSFGALATTRQGNSNLCSFFDHEQPSNSELDAFTYTPKPTYHAIRHAFRWIKRGASRVTASGSGPLELVAFRNPDARVAVFGVNNGSSGTYTVTLSTSPAPSSLTPRVSTSGSYDQVGAPVALSSGSGSFTIPGASVFTLVEEASGGSGGMGGAGGSGGGMAGAGGAGQAGGGAGGAGAGGMPGGAGGQPGAGMGGSAAGSPGSVQFRTSSYTGTASSTSIPRASAIEGGDLMLLGHLAYDSTSTTSNATSLGFTLVATDVRSTGQIARLWVFRKVAAGSPGSQTTEPTSFTVTNSGGNYQDILLFSVHGFDASAPIQASTTANGSSTSMSVPGITVARAGSLGLWWKMGYYGTTGTNPSGFTMVVADQDTVNDIGRKAFGVGATGAVTSAQSPSSSWVNAFVVVQP